jgi:hypothetical protein
MGGVESKDDLKELKYIEAGLDDVKINTRSGKIDGVHEDKLDKAGELLGKICVKESSWKNPEDEKETILQQLGICAIADEANQSNLEFELG